MDDNIFKSLSCATPLYSSEDGSTFSKVSAVRETSSKVRLYFISFNSIKNSPRLHMDKTLSFSSFGLGGVIIMEEVDLVEIDEEAIVMEVVVVMDVFVLEVVVVVVVVGVDVRVKVAVENWLADDPVRFGTYHRLNSNHRS